MGRDLPLRARRWLSVYSGQMLAEGGQLADTLRCWLNQQQLPGARASTLPPVRVPLVFERNGRRLTIRLLGHSGDGQVLGLVERRATPAPESLRKLGLTPRQAEVLSWLALGKTNAEIGTILGLSPGTVHKHTERIFTRLGVETRTAAAARAWESTRTD